MTAAVSSPEDVVNIALAALGQRLRVRNLFEGTPQAMLALDVYSQTRDALLRENDWGFAERNVALTLLKQAPIGGYIPPLTWSTTYPPLPWLFEYAYPTDCLKARAVKAAPLFLPNFDPQPNVFDTPNDNSLAPPAKVIVCNVPDAVLVYTGQVTNPATWESDFVEAVVDALRKRLAAAIAGLQPEQLAATEEAQSKMTAEMERG